MEMILKIQYVTQHFASLSWMWCIQKDCGFLLWKCNFAKLEQPCTRYGYHQGLGYDDSNTLDHKAKMLRANVRISVFGSVALKILSHALFN